MTLLATNPIVAKIVIKTQAEIESPTAEMLADYSAIYQLDEAPYTKYYTTGTTLEASTLTTADVDSIIAANEDLGAMAPAVQSLIDAGVALAIQKANHTGNDAAQNIVFSDGKTLEQWRAEVTVGQSPTSTSDPVVTTDPVITGSPTVGSTLTLTAGTVTEGTGGSSAVDFGAGVETNTTRRYTTSATTELNDTSGWAVGCWIRNDASPPAVNQMFVGFGTFGAANSFQLCSFTGVNKYGCSFRDGVGAADTAAAAYPAAGDYLLVAQYSDADGSVRFYQTIKGGTVSGASDSTAFALGTITPGSGWYIGGDAASNYCACPLGEVFVIDRRLTNGEMTTLAAGAPITTILTPQLYWKFANGAGVTESNLGSVGSADATIVGSGYTTTTGFFSANTHNNIFTWRLTTLAGAISDLFTETISGTTSTFPVTAAQLGNLPWGNTISGFHQPQDTVTGRKGNTRQSNIVGPVTGTQPVNTVAPTISGSAPAGSDISGLAGTWTGASTFSMQLLASGVPVGTATAASASTTQTLGTSNGTQVGKSLTTSVVAYSSLGVPSDPASSSNSITVTGTAVAVSNTVAPAWPANVYLETTATLTAGTWTGTINATRTYDFYKTSVLPGNLLRAGNTVALFTPHATESTGLTLTADDLLFFVETVTETDTGLTYSATSASKTLEAIPAAFAATLTAIGAAGLNLVVGQVMAQANVATMSGGTPPYKLNVTTPWTPQLPLGLAGSVSGSSLLINGTPTVVAGTASFQANLLDSAGTPATATATVPITVASASVTPLRLLLPFSVDANGATQSWVNGNADINGGDGVVRWGTRADPGGSGQNVFICRVKSGDGLVSGGQRSECVSRYNPAVSGNSTPSSNSFLWWDNDNWLAFAHWLPATSGSSGWPTSSTSNDRQALFQIHSNNGETPPFELQYHAQTGVMRYYVSGTAIGNDIQIGSDWTPTRAVWIKHIIHWRVSFTGSRKLEIWRAEGSGAGVTYTKVVDNSTTAFGWSDAPSTDDYPKGPIYKYGTDYGSLTDRYLYYKGLWKDVGVNLFSNAQSALSVL